MSEVMQVIKDDMEGSDVEATDETNVPTLQEMQKYDDLTDVRDGMKMALVLKDFGHIFKNAMDPTWIELDTETGDMQGVICVNETQAIQLLQAVNASLNVLSPITGTNIPVFVKNEVRQVLGGTSRPIPRIMTGVNKRKRKKLNPNGTEKKKEYKPFNPHPDDKSHWDFTKWVKYYSEKVGVEPQDVDNVETAIRVEYLLIDYMIKTAPGEERKDLSIEYLNDMLFDKLGTIILRRKMNKILSRRIVNFGGLPAWRRGGFVVPLSQEEQVGRELSLKWAKFIPVDMAIFTQTDVLKVCDSTGWNDSETFITEFSSRTFVRNHYSNGREKVEILRRKLEERQAIVHALHAAQAEDQSQKEPSPGKESPQKEPSLSKEQSQKEPTPAKESTDVSQKESTKEAPKSLKNQSKTTTPSKITKKANTKEMKIDPSPTRRSARAKK